MFRLFYICMLACPMTSFAYSTALHPLVAKHQKAPLVSTFPFKLIDNTILIPATIDNHLGYCILDSGSPSLILNARHFQNKRVEATNFRSADLTGSGATQLGKTRAHLEVGNIERRNQEAFLINLSSIEKSKNIDILGVIGYKFLKHFEVVLNFQQKEITLFALDKRGERELKAPLHMHPAQVINLKKSRHFLYLEAKVNDETIKLGLDCGAAKSILGKQAIRKYKGFFTPSHGASLVSFNGKKSGINIGTIKQVFIGESQIDQLEIILMDLSQINRNLVTKLDGLLGNTFISQHKTAINYKKQELYIWAPKSQAQSSVRIGK